MKWVVLWKRGRRKHWAIFDDEDRLKAYLDSISRLTLSTEIIVVQGDIVGRAYRAGEKWNVETVGDVLATDQAGDLTLII